MLGTLGALSPVAQIALVAGLVLLLVGIVVMTLKTLRGAARRAHHYPDQPTIPVLFQPHSAPGPGQEVPMMDDWKPHPSGAKGVDPTEMIGSRHGPTKEGVSPAPQARTGVAEADLPRSPSRPVAPVDETRAAPEIGGGAASQASPPRPAHMSSLRTPSTDVPEAQEDEDHTLQLLPGRLEVVAGGLRGREIRFVRAGSDTYTFGRQPGPDQTHIQLENATVSRRHAAMRFVNGRWRIRNLSQTNPIRINGEIADTPHKEYTLQDGDRIELGEVAFLFRGK